MKYSAAEFCLTFVSKHESIPFMEAESPRSISVALSCLNRLMPHEGPNVSLLFQMPPSHLLFGGCLCSLAHSRVATCYQKEL